MAISPLPNEYNEWPNRETWAVALHLTSNQTQYDQCKAALPTFVGRIYLDWDSQVRGPLPSRRALVGFALRDCIGAVTDGLADGGDGSLRILGPLGIERTPIVWSHRVDWARVGDALCTQECVPTTYKKAAPAQTTNLRLRYFSHRDRFYAWNTQVMDAPGGRWFALEYRLANHDAHSQQPAEWSLVRQVRCGTRRAAKAKALAWYRAAMAKEQSGWRWLTISCQR